MHVITSVAIRIRIRIRIAVTWMATKIYSLVQWPVANVPWKFHANPFRSFCAKLLTDRQTDKQTTTITYPPIGGGNKHIVFSSNYCFAVRTHAPTFIQNEQLAQVNTFPYPGSLITEDGECTTEFRTRLSRGQAIGASLQKIWRSHSIPISTKTRLTRNRKHRWATAKPAACTPNAVNTREQGKEGGRVM